MNWTGLQFANWTSVWKSHEPSDLVRCSVCIANQFVVGRDADAGPGQLPCLTDLFIYLFIFIHLFKQQRSIRLFADFIQTVCSDNKTKLILNTVKKTYFDALGVTGSRQFSSVRLLWTRSVKWILYIQPAWLAGGDGHVTPASVASLSRHLSDDQRQASAPHESFTTISNTADLSQATPPPTAS